MSRIMLLVPILLKLSDFLDCRRPCGRQGILLGGMFGTFLPGAAILSAGVPNNVLMGASETVLGHSPSFGSYLLLHFPVLGLLKTALLAALIIHLYPDSKPSAPAGDRLENRPLNAPEKALAILLSIGVCCG